MHASLEKGFTEAEKQPVTTTQTGTGHSTTAPGIGGILAGGGVAFAALSSSLAFITTSLSKVDKGKLSLHRNRIFDRYNITFNNNSSP